MENHLEILITVIKPGLLEKIPQFGSMFFFQGISQLAAVDDTGGFPTLIQPLLFSEPENPFKKLISPSIKGNLMKFDQQQKRR
jgi:hypothetical protein